MDLFIVCHVIVQVVGNGKGNVQGATIQLTIYQEDLNLCLKTSLWHRNSFKHMDQLVQIFAFHMCISVKVQSKC